MKAQQLWRKFEKGAASEKTEMAATQQKLISDVSLWENRWQEQTEKLRVAEAQVLEKSAESQKLSQEKVQELSNWKDAVKVIALMLYSLLNSYFGIKKVR